jgi:hypothetical protein
MEFLHSVTAEDGALAPDLAWPSATALALVFATQ